MKKLLKFKAWLTVPEAARYLSILFGEDVAEAGTPFKVLAGLVDEFGVARIVDSPISEAGITGLGVGAAMTGMRPVVDIMFGDFLTLVMDQLANQAAKAHYMSGGKLQVPLVLRTTLGATRRSAAQHSQSCLRWGNGATAGNTCTATRKRKAFVAAHFSAPLPIRHASPTV